MRNYIKALFYRGLCPFLLFIGVDKLFRMNRKHKKLIIMYHGVSLDNTPRINGRHLPAGQFEKQLVYFKNNFNIVRLEDLCGMKFSGVTPDEHTIALTFDDGFLNNFSNALPLLRKHDIPATFFISSASLEDHDYVHPADYLDIINFCTAQSVEINGRVFKKDTYHLTGTEGAQENIYQYINSLNFPLWKQTLSDLRLMFPEKLIAKQVHEETYKLITSSILPSLLSEPLITIGSHGHWHVNLAKLSDEEVNEQLETSTKIFRNHAVWPINCIAFPSGYFNDEVLSAAHRHGYKFCIAAGSVERKYADLVFPRVGVLNLASFAFNILSINRSFSRFGF